MVDGVEGGDSAVVQIAGEGPLLARREIDPAFPNVYFNLALVQAINNDPSAAVAAPYPITSGGSDWLFIRMSLLVSADTKLPYQE